jgi:membrane fusion protein (multidrug efflux system)
MHKRRPSITEWLAPGPDRCKSVRVTRFAVQSSLALLLVCAPLASIGCGHERAKAETRAGAGKQSGPAKPVPIDVQVVRPAQLDVPIRATGTLVPAESIQIVAELSRRLVRISAEEGAEVKQGQVLFELDHSDLDAEFAQLTVSEELAKKTAARHAELLKEFATSQAEYDAAVSRVEELSAQRHTLAVTRDKAVIRAPFSGVLGLRQVSQGAWVSPSTPLITLSAVKSLKVDFKVPERYAAYITVGRSLELEIEGRAEKLHGKVSATEGSVDASSRSLSVRALIEDAKGVSPGSFVRIELPVQIAQALTVPSIVVIPGAAGSSVFVERDGRAVSVAVEIGLRGPDWVLVESGLEAGDRVALSNLLRLKDGASVEVTRVLEAPSVPMAPNGAAAPGGATEPAK